MKIFCFLVLLFFILDVSSTESCGIGGFKNSSLLINDSTKNVDLGIVYFSNNNGLNWESKNDGLPIKMKIGLGGLAVSDEWIGIASKEYGVYLYDFYKKIWINIPTDIQIIHANIGALAIFDNVIYIGTQHKGIYLSKNKGQTWTNFNPGLTNKSIRRFCEFEKKLYVCTNDGFYALNKSKNNWETKFRQELLQTNGATLFKRKLYLATNRGIYQEQPKNTWINLAPDLVLHNISSTPNEIFAMTYNKLLMVSKDGKIWKSQQDGLPIDLYTFDVIKQGNSIFAAQWDGIYNYSFSDTKWMISNNGLPKGFAVTNLKSFKNLLVLSTSEHF